MVPPVAEPDLLGDVRRALADDHPLGLLNLVSSVLAVMDSRRSGPLERTTEAEKASYADLLASFMDTDLRETTALLAVIAEIETDDLIRARIRREVASRQHRLPGWIAGLDRIEPYRAVEMVHVLGDGDDVIVGARLPSGHEISVLVYIDHNLGTVAKDGFVLDHRIGDLVAFMRAKVEDPDDTRWDDIALADARARISEAIEAGAITYPPYETDTWPATRPLVEWITRLLPGGGSGYQRPEWSEKAVADLTERFFASPHGVDLDDADHRSLLDSVLWFGTDYGPGDPLRWSPVAVEILLVDWIPRKIVADVAYLSLAPDLLRAVIRFSHDERGIRPALTEETLAAADRWEPDYQRIIRSPRPQGPQALLAAMGVVDPDGPWPMPGETIEEIMLDGLRHAVGGDQALGRLHDRPLPDEAFEWTGIPDDVRQQVGEVLALVDRCCKEMFDVEVRTACRRFLTRAVAGDPDAFRRKGRPEMTAAAICWVVGKANYLFSNHGGQVMVKDVMANFGFTRGGPSQRADVLMRAGGFPPNEFGDISLASPAFLTSARRQDIILLRERYGPT